MKAHSFLIPFIAVALTAGVAYAAEPANTATRGANDNTGQTQQSKPHSSTAPVATSASRAINAIGDAAKSGMSAASSVIDAAGTGIRNAVAGTGNKSHRAKDGSGRSTSPN